MDEFKKESDEAYSARKEKISDFLRSEGFRPEYDDYGEVFFKQESMRVCFLACQNDLSYYRVVRYNVIDINNEDEAIAALEACNSLNRSMKLAKCHLNESRKTVYIEVPAFYRNVEDLISVAGRLINQASSCHQDLLLKYKYLLLDGLAATEMSKALGFITSNGKKSENPAA